MALFGARRNGSDSNIIETNSMNEGSSGLNISEQFSSYYLLISDCIKDK